MTHHERASQFIKSMLQPKMSEEQWKDFLTQRRGKEALQQVEALTAQFYEAEDGESGTIIHEFSVDQWTQEDYERIRQGLKIGPFNPEAK